MTTCVAPLQTTDWKRESLKRCTMFRQT